VRKLRYAALSGAIALALGVSACGDSDDSSGDATSGGGDSASLSGTIRIDGSSTVAPLTEAMAERFMAENPGVRISVGTSGTGGGFEKFCQGETDMNDASDKIDEETIAACESAGIAWEEVTVANDALTVVANPENPIQCLTVEQVQEIWGPRSTITNWSQVSGTDPSFDQELVLFGPGTDSGTFAYFTEAINGEEGAQRTKYNNVGEDDNQTVTGVAGAPGGLGYFGFSFYEENTDTLKAMEIDGGAGCVAPSPETVADETYRPLARGLFVYPSAEALARPEVDAFLRFYLDNVEAVAPEVGYIALTPDQLSESQAELERLISAGGGSAEESGS
jgi:phosphate transport system substrate-binding protein